MTDSPHLIPRESMRAFSDLFYGLTQLRCPSNSASACSKTCLYASTLLKLDAKSDESAWTWTSVRHVWAKKRVYGLFYHPSNVGDPSIIESNSRCCIDMEMKLKEPAPKLSHSPRQFFF